MSGQRYESGCRWKCRYTKKQAKRVLRQIQQRSPGHTLNVYRCEFCDWWHVGNSRELMRRRARKAS